MKRILGKFRQILMGLLQGIFRARSATVSTKRDRTVLPHQTRKPCERL